MDSSHPSTPNGPLRKALKKVLVDQVINSVDPSEGSVKVLVVDRAALRILSSAMNHKQIIDQGFGVIEILEIKREPMSTVPAVYLITPTVESVHQLCEEKRHQYKSYRVFFTSHVPDYLISVIKEKCQFFSKMKAFVELNMRFLALESRLFSLDRQGASIPQLHSADFGNDKMKSELSDTADRLAEVCTTIAPSTTNWTIRHDGMSFTARTLGSLVNEEMKDLVRKQHMKQRQKKGNSEDELIDNNSGSNKPKQATLLIIDRVSDLVTPLVHDYTYQAMVHDLLPLNYRKPGGAHLEVPDDDPKRKSDTKLLQIDEEDVDPVWSTIRPMFIQDALQHSQSAFQSFLQNDPAYRIRGKPGNEVDLKDMSAAVRALQSSRIKADKHVLHIQAAKKCLERVANTNLTELALAEQDLIIGRAADGSKFKVDAIIEMTMSILEDESKYDLNDRLRLFFLCLIVVEGMTGLANEASYLATSQTFISKMKRLLIERFSQHWVDTYLSDEQRSALKGLQRLLAIAHDGYSRLLWKINPEGAHHTKAGDHLTAKLAQRFAQRQETKRRRKELRQRRKRHIQGRLSGIDEEGASFDKQESSTASLNDGDDDSACELPSAEATHYDVARYVPPLWGIMMDMVEDLLDNDAFPKMTELSVESILIGSSDDIPPGREQSSSSSSHRRGGLFHRRHDESTRTKGTDSYSSSSEGRSSIGSDPSLAAVAKNQAGNGDDLYMVFIVGGVSYSEVRAMYDICSKRGVNIVLGASNILTPATFLRNLAAIDDPVIRLQVLLPPLPLELAVIRAPELQKKQMDSYTPSVANSSQQQQTPEQQQQAQELDNEFHQRRMNEEIIRVEPYKKKGFKKLFKR